MKPYVILNSVVSLDGKTGKLDGEDIFSNRLDDHRLHTLRGSSDVIMVGVETIKGRDPDLIAHELTEVKPLQVIVDENDPAFQAPHKADWPFLHA